MKTLVSSILLLGAFAVNAEVVTVTLPKAGTFLVTLSAPTNCMVADYSLYTMQMGYPGEEVPFLNVGSKMIDELFGRAQVCADNGINTGTGVFKVNKKTQLNITVDAGLENPTVKISEVVKTKVRK